MTYRLEAFADVGLTQALLKLVIDEHRRCLPRLDKLWTYYRNPLQPVGAVGGAAGSSWNSDWSRPGPWYRQSQECGLPARLVARAGSNQPLTDDRSATRREVVIENDIAWRVQSMVDFMFGKPVSMVSTAANEAQRRTIERVLDRVWENSGGIALLQDMALLGHVFGHVDLILRFDDEKLLDAIRQEPQGSLDRALVAADALRIEVVEPRRGIAILDENDYRQIAAYVINYERDANAAKPSTLLERFRRLSRDENFPSARQRTCITEVISPSAWQIYEDTRLAYEQTAPGALTDGRVPVVHIQNISQPFEYEGIGEVEALIPLQDELNTRLSDRASRVTLQCFKMYLAKGIDGFEKMPIGPGQVFSTENPAASIESFGGDEASPSEDAHIQQVRDALDKVSGIPPLASGVIQAKIGSLSSANALRITLMGVLSKTARKHVTYGGGISRMCELILTVLGNAGALATSKTDRGIRLTWPDPLPPDTREQVMAAEAKAKLGVPPERVLAELGYQPTDPGIT